ncbi:UNVERIFIED_CONTAM: hypothetical protein HDU68_006396, partial [Siphonaria sp. JEL0065]
MDTIEPQSTVDLTANQATSIVAGGDADQQTQPSQQTPEGLDAPDANDSRSLQQPHAVKFANTPVAFPPNGKPAQKLSALVNHGVVGHPSSAVNTMKATAAMKDQDALKYMKKFTTSPYAAKSAKVQRQPIVPLPTPSKSPKFPSLTVLDTAKSLPKRTKSRSIDDSLPELTGPRPDYESQSKPKPFHPENFGAWPLHPSLIKHSPDNDPPVPQVNSHPKRSESRGRKGKSHSESEDESSEVEPSPEVKEKKMRDRLTLVKEEILADEHLLRLADKASQPDEILAALTALVEIAAGNGKLAFILHATSNFSIVLIAQDSLFDRGGVAILLHILQKYPLDLDIQAKSCKLLELMGRANNLTFKALYKQKGILAILGVVQNLYNGKNQKPKVPFEDEISLPSPTVAITDQPPPLQSSDTSLRKPTKKTATAKQTPHIDSLLLFKELVDNQFSTEVINRVLQPTYDNEALRKSCFVLQNTHYLLGMKHGRASNEENFEHFVYKTICDTKLILTCEHAMLYLIDPFTGEFFAADYDPTLTRLEKTLIRDKKYDPKDSGLAGTAILTKRSYNIKDDASNSTNFKLEVDARGFSSKIFSVLCVPLIAESGEVRGVLEVLNKLNSNDEVSFFDAADEFLLKHLSAQIINAMTTFKVHQRLQTLEHQYNLILATAMSLRGSFGIDELAERVVNGAKDILSADRSGLFLIDSKSNDLTSKILCNEYIQKVQLSVDAGIVGCTFRQGAIINVPNAYEDPRFNPEIDKRTGYNTRSILSAPLSNTEGQIFGVLQILNKKNGVFGTEDERLLRFFAAQGNPTVALDKSDLMKRKGDFAQMANDTKNHLKLVLHSVTNIIITLEDTGMIREVNYPSLLEVDPELAVSITTHTYKDLFTGDTDQKLISEIQLILDSKTLSETVKGHCIVTFGNKPRNVNYEVRQVSEVEISTGLTRKLVVVLLEDVTITQRAVRTLGRYITPDLASRVLSENGSALGGAHIKVATLFSNIREYSSLAETLEPEKLVPWLNEHLESTLKVISSEE